MAERVFTREDAKSLIRSNSKIVKIPSDFTAIGSGALAGFSQIEELVIPEGVTRIASNAFYTRSFKNTCKVRRLSIPSSLTNFERWCFFGCDNLEIVNLPEGFSIPLALELFWQCYNAALCIGKTGGFFPTGATWEMHISPFPFYSFPLAPATPK